MRTFSPLRGGLLLLLVFSLSFTVSCTEESEFEALVPGGMSLTGYASGNRDGFFHSMWTQGPGQVRYSLDADGAYTVAWKDVFNWVGGRGWNPGTTKVVGYEADYRPEGNSYLCLYGWTRNPLIEYYVVESWGNWRPPGGQSIGTVESDGGVYDIYKTDRINQPSIDGTRTFVQFWSVRRTKQTSGTITLANHFAAWEAYGMKLGTHDYQVMATEGYRSSGYSKVHVWEVTD